MPLTRPKADVVVQDSAPPGAALTDTSTAFVVGLSHKGVAAGPLAEADVLHSLADFIAKYGARQTYNGMEYDAVEAAFADGCTALYFSRKVGPAAVKAQANVPTSGSQFTAVAKGPGAYANTYKIGVSGGVVTVKDGSTVLETSPVLADVAALQLWATQTSREIDITPIGSGALTNSADVTLAGGTDDRTNITDTQIQTALDRFGRKLGPGQVAAPGDTRSAMHQMLATHARDNNRFAYGDAPDSATAATVAAAGTAVRALGTELARHIQIIDGWVYGPPLTAGGSPRTVPGSGVMLGGAATIDAAGNPNVAVAGPNFASRFATAVKWTRSDTDLDTLAAAGVTPLLVDEGAVRPYDDITPVDPDADPEWVGAAGNRMAMRIISDARSIAKAHMFQQVDPKLATAAYGGDLEGMLKGWFAKRALFSQDGSEAGAFRVATGPNVNTVATIQARQLRASLSFHLSPNSRQVTVLITNTPLNAAL